MGIYRLERAVATGYKEREPSYMEGRTPDGMSGIYDDEYELTGI